MRQKLDHADGGSAQTASAGPQDAAALSLAFKQAMRCYASSVSIITVAHGAERSGFTATSVTSFAAEPPMLLVTTRASSSTALLLEHTARMAVNLLAPSQQALAERFSGLHGTASAERYGDAVWTQLQPNGAPVLAEALVVMDCQVEEKIVRYGQMLIMARVLATRLADGQTLPLQYWQGQYR